jgi:hypothetical protein
MNIEPDFFQSGYCAETSVGDNESRVVARNNEWMRWFFIKRLLDRFISQMVM